MKPAIARRLALAALGKDYTWIDPSTPRLSAIVSAIAGDAELGGAESARRGTASAGSPYFFEISKVLLEAWLRRRGPVRIQDLMRRVGCSHPTVSSALDDLDRRSEILRTRDRRAELRGLPRQTLEEVVVRGDALRQTHWLIDASGRKGDPAALLRRLQRALPSGVGLGGVVAARHYDPKLDLHGTPRIDLSVWSPRGTTYDPAAIAQVDPGLRVTSARDPDAIVAVHRIARADSLFEPIEGKLAYADVAETFLDLHELRLDAQAQALVKHLRGEAS
jgi:hypothetical protein